MQTTLQRIESRTFPENAKIQNIGKWVIGTYASTRNGRTLYGLKIYRGNKAKSYIWRLYESENSFKSTLEYYIKEATTEAAYDEAKKTAVHDFKIGDIVYNSWGYEQTNIDFYQVVKTTKSTITIRRIGQQTTETGFMSGDTTPIKDKFISNDLYVKKPYMLPSGEWWINFEYGAGRKVEENESLRCSWYA